MSSLFPPAHHRIPAAVVSPLLPCGGRGVAARRCNASDSEQAAALHPLLCCRASGSWRIAGTAPTNAGSGGLSTFPPKLPRGQDDFRRQIASQVALFPQPFLATKLPDGPCF